MMSSRLVDQTAPYEKSLVPFFATQNSGVYMSIAVGNKPSRPLVEDVAESVERDVFVDHPEASFYIGVIATPGVVHDPRIYQATSKFRANVYIDEMGFLDENARRRSGGETDSDDNRSVHFSVVENKGEHEPPRVVGCSRLILKKDENVPLPVEIFFPEYFDENPAPIDSAEGSRLIARHEDRAVQGMIALGLIRAMTSWSVDASREPVFAVVEKGLARTFDRMRLPNTRLTDLKYLEEYRTENMALAISPKEIEESIKPERHVSRGNVRGFFDDVATHHGIGFFDRTLMEQVA